MSEEVTTETTDQGAASARIRQLVARVKELESRVVELEPVAAQAEKWRNQVDEVKAASKAEREALRVEREIAAAGITDAEGMEYVQHAYGKLPTEGRPPLSEWLAAPDGLPKAVRAYLPASTPAAPAATTTAAPAAPVVPSPRTSTGTIPQAPSEPQAWSPEAIARLSPADFRANLEAIMAAVRTG
jgi:TolA-binding protein